MRVIAPMFKNPAQRDAYARRLAVEIAAIESMNRDLTDDDWGKRNDNLRLIDMKRDQLQRIAETPTEDAT